MKQHQLLAVPRPLLTLSPGGLSVAILSAGLLLFAGYFLGARSASVPLSGTGKPQFALLVKADDTPPADPEQQFREYSQWVENLKKTRWAGGEALHGKAWRITKPEGGDSRIAAHELKASPDELSGYFLYEADNEQEALEIAKTCPHLNYKGTLELREIFK